MKTQIRGRAGLSTAALLLTAGRCQAVLPPSDEETRAVPRVIITDSLAHCAPGTRG
jgi:hypothetical protein